MSLNRVKAMYMYHDYISKRQTCQNNSTIHKRRLFVAMKEVGNSDYLHTKKQKRWKGSITCSSSKDNKLDMKVVSRHDISLSIVHLTKQDFKNSLKKLRDYSRTVTEESTVTLLECNSLRGT